MGPRHPGQHSWEHRCRCLTSPNPTTSTRHHHQAGGPAPSTSTLAVPCDAPSSSGITGVGSSRAFDIGSTNVGDCTSAIADRGGPGATMAGSPTLTADDSTKGGHVNVAVFVTG
jgi:hypothetical protein